MKEISAAQAQDVDVQIRAERIDGDYEKRRE